MSTLPGQLPRRFCANHPHRAAIGVCVMTAVPICGECSTRYEGVNYSREGLRLLQQNRADAARSGRGSGLVLTALGVCLTPLFAWGVYLAYEQTAVAVLALLQKGP